MLDAVAEAMTQPGPKKYLFACADFSAPAAVQAGIPKSVAGKDLRLVFGSSLWRVMQTNPRPTIWPQVGLAKGLAPHFWPALLNIQLTTTVNIV